MTKGKALEFPDHPEFRPNLTPTEMFTLGVFGGTYWRPIHSSVLGKDLKNQHRHADVSPLFRHIPEILLSNTSYDVRLNHFNVKAGSTLHDWESHGWIKAQDPYGWVQWYCRFYQGRRSPDDQRQIQRWINYADPNKGRWYKRYHNGGKSPVIAQGLLQWAMLVN
jgi:hypothetical protein